MTTGETTSHPTKQPEDGCQVVGYSHLTDGTTDKTTSHLTNPAKDAAQVIGYSGACAATILNYCLLVYRAGA
jgi:hypothetical protein